jgi:hypothetical protein
MKKDLQSFLYLNSSITIHLEKDEQNTNKQRPVVVGEGVQPHAAAETDTNASIKTSAIPEDGKEQSPSLAPVAEINTETNPQHESMEVHKHPHHVMHKKKWSEYLIEFLLLFLAVFLGFIAENMREHQVEKRRAREFARLLVGDLAADTSELNKASRVLDRIIGSGDSLGTLLTKGLKKTSGGKLYYYEYWSGWQWSVISQDATLQQLKASGALRYFNTDVVRKIMDYEQSINVIYLLQNKYEPEKIANWNLVQKVFDQHYFNILDSIRPRDSSIQRVEINDPKLIWFLNTDFPLISYDRANLQEISNWASNSSRNYRTTRKDIHHAKDKARELIRLLASKYHFD